MVKAEQGDKVQVQYTGSFENGEIFDSSGEGPPLEFVIGERQVIPGFEAAVIGMEEGESKKFQVSPQDAYGMRDDNLMYKFNRDELPDDLDVKVGQHVQMTDGEGHSMPAIVTDISEQDIQVDANHPLAGHDLTFEIKMLGVDKPAV